ncbi:MAG TPA: methyltransferase domain-containing protein [Candidatus Binatia bacterium]|nr:methyltransferase domain-containing protein [Candidatus Binatia bacterium]
MSEAKALDYAKVRSFLGQAASDVGTALFGALSFIGDRLELFKTMSAAGPVTIDELAARTRLHPRYLREWLNAMTTAGYVVHDPASGRYTLPAEHAAVLADETSPFFLGGFLEMIVPSVMQAPKLVKAFRNGKGVPQSAYPPETFEAIERSTAPWYRHKLTQEWIPAMPDVKAKLEAGASALDVGCGSGRASIAIAKAFPKARVFGYDNHPGSVDRARANAKAEGVGKRVTFKTVDAKRLRGPKFDFISTFDVVHDSADPVGLMKAIGRSLDADGTYLMLEMNCSANVNENINFIGKFLYSVSTLYCMTQSLAQNGEGIGAAMGEPKARELAAAAGFTHFRRLPIEEPFSILYELRH